MRNSPVSEQRPRVKARIVGEAFKVVYKNAHGQRVFRDVKLQSIDYKRAERLGKDTLRTMADNGVNVDDVKVVIISVVVR